MQRLDPAFSTLKRLLKYFVAGAVTVFLLAITATAILRFYWQRQTAARLRISSAEGIHALEKIQLGGIEQWVLIRGQDSRKPVMLYLHGGPGFPEMPFSHLNAALEWDFVVVHWDQRGAGKSYPILGAKPAMNVEQFVSDTRDLSLWLRQRLGAKKIYLVAHSWGSMFGALTVARYPELFEAYVSLGQVAGLPQIQEVRYDFALHSAEQERNKKAVAALEKIGRPPHQNFDTCLIMEKWVDYYAAREHRGVSRWKWVGLAFRSPAYSWLDCVRIPLGFTFSFAQLWRELFYQTNLFDQASKLDVPVYFFVGRHDHVATARVAEQYFHALDAPQGKQLIWFEDSGHWPQLEEAQKYRDTLVNRVLKETRESSSGLTR